jgi:hypothetical protein
MEHKITPDPDRWDAVRKMGLNASEVWEEGARMTLSPEYLDAFENTLRTKAAALATAKHRRIDQINEEHLLETAQPILREFLQAQGRELGPDFWHKGSPHFDRFQRRLSEWASQPEIQVRLREAGVPEQAVQPLLIAHLSK